jgi:hypothetical protein
MYPNKNKESKMNNNDPRAVYDKCIPQETNINNVQLAQAYVPYQKLCNTFTPLGALTVGTAFPSLYAVSGWDPRQKAEYDDE